jgi:dolichyl-phosphate-mannose--protein O-mannosyl transferase
MYLHSDTGAVYNRTKVSRQQVVDAVPERTYECAWRAMYYDPEYRLEEEGNPVPCGTKIVIAHCKTGQALHSDPARTAYASSEGEVSAAARLRHCCWCG